MPIGCLSTVFGAQKGMEHFWMILGGKYPVLRNSMEFLLLGSTHIWSIGVCNAPPVNLVQLIEWSFLLELEIKKHLFKTT